MNPRAVLAAGLAASILAWLAGSELPGPARAAMAFLIGIFPALGVLQAAAASEVDALPGRMRLYASTIVGLWALTFAIAFAASESGFNPRLMGVITMPVGPFVLWTSISLAAVASLVLAFKAFGTSETPVIQHLIPQSLGEKAVYLGVSVTAGICEEFVFRGFLIAALRAATGSMAAAVMLSAAVFGIAHAHQNAMGALRAGLLALVLSVPLLITGSLYPGIAAHALIDIVAGLWLAKWLLRS